MTTETITRLTQTVADWEMILANVRSLSFRTDEVPAATDRAHLTDFADYIEGTIWGVVEYKWNENVTIKATDEEMGLGLTDEEMVVNYLDHAIEALNMIEPDSPSA